MIVSTVSAVNYALKKKASQSSIYELYGIHYTPDKAVDGSHNTDGLKPPYFAHTQDSVWAELNPWWQVSIFTSILDSYTIWNNHEFYMKCMSPFHGVFHAFIWFTMLAHFTVYYK